MHGACDDTLGQLIMAKLSLGAILYACKRTSLPLKNSIDAPLLHNRLVCVYKGPATVDSITLVPPASKTDGSIFTTPINERFFSDTKQNILMDRNPRCKNAYKLREIDLLRNSVAKLPSTGFQLFTRSGSASRIHQCYGARPPCTVTERRLTYSLCSMVATKNHASQNLRVAALHAHDTEWIEILTATGTAA
jgi:hypothetical protein